MEAWFVSDIHIKDLKERNGEILLRFLHELGQKKDVADIHLFLLGDIFDLWVGGSSVFVKKFQPLVDAVRALRDAGARVTYIEGNHDVHIESFWQKKLGVEVFVEAQYYNLNGLTVRVEHGDLINLTDETYLRYRAVIRHPWMKPLSWIIPGRFFDEVGNYAARKSRKRSQGYRTRNEDGLVAMIRNHIPRAFAEKPFDVIISGHMHVFDDHETEMAGRPVRSFNLGSWYGDVKVLKLSGTHFEWVPLANP